MSATNALLSFVSTKQVGRTGSHSRTRALAGPLETDSCSVGRSATHAGCSSGIEALLLNDKELSTRPDSSPRFVSSHLWRSLVQSGPASAFRVEDRRPV